MQFFLLIVIFVLILWTVKDPFIGLLGLLMLNILRPGEIYPLFATLHVERIAAIVVLLSLLAHERRVATPKITKAVLFFWGTMFAAIPLAFWIGQSISTTVEFGQIVVYHLLIVTLVNTEERFTRFLVTFAILNAWLAGSSLYLYMTGSFVYTMNIERATGLTSAGGDPNTLALTLVSGLPLVLLLLTRETGKLVKLIGLGAAAVSILTVINTGSRTNFFTLLLLSLGFVATRKKWFLYVPAIIVVMAIAWTFIPQQYKARYETVNNLEKDESYQNRLLAWKAGWSMFKDNPFTGMGPGNFEFASGTTYWPGEGRKHWLNAHSLPLKALGELGSLGTFAFIYMLVTLFKLNGRLRRELSGSGLPGTLRFFPVACNFALVALLIAGYSSHNLYRSTWYMLASMSGALQLLWESHAAHAEDAPQESAPVPLESMGSGVSPA